MVLLKTSASAVRSLYLPAAHNDAAFTIVAGSPQTWLDTAVLLWLAVVNVATFLVFGLDKWKARRKAENPRVRRVPERTLFLMAAAGGSVGALAGMRVFHHKTRHKSFTVGIPLILLAQLALPLVLYGLDIVR